MSGSSSAWNGMSGPFSRRGPADCERCHRRTEATWPWHGWHALRKVWLVLIGFLVASSPLYLADMHGMLPAAMVLVFAIGPLNALASIRATCLECGAIVEPPVHTNQAAQPHSGQMF